ncbi:hypothetical protein K2V56_02550 [Staphylococcus chromogenes]|uniref:hypothetical protein n=1 Tax=Staphylococcus chromogenes TaxID=46126 RepID=UPI001E5939DB|nr:hypothetical protein [Staphylococcus chromogenes]MCD8904344.1 hypothetical protein [Staphylococcus chromogenes]
MQKIKEKYGFTDMIFLIVLLVGGVFPLLFMFLFVNLDINKMKEIIEILLNTSSISIGFFSTIFTFIFGLKENRIYRKIMSLKKTRRQFKFLNYAIISSGFLQIIISLVCIFIINLDLNNILFKYMSHIINNMMCLSFNSLIPITICYYMFFAVYLFTICIIVFKEDDSYDKKNVDMPEIQSRASKNTNNT